MAFRKAWASQQRHRGISSWRQATDSRMGGSWEAQQFLTLATGCTSQLYPSNPAIARL